MISRATLLTCLLLLPLAARAATTQAPANRGASNGHDACGLLTTAEVEAVLGPLAGPPFQAVGARPRPNAEECRYETAGFRAISVKVLWTGGAQMIGMMGAVQGMVKKAGLAELKLTDGTTVAGAWDDARVSQCCEFNALRGDQLVTVNIAGSYATLQQAGRLADAAVKRLDQPLAIAGEDGIKPAQERFLLRPKRRSVCDLLTQADAEAITHVALSAPPKGGEESCSYAWPLSAATSNYTLKLEVTWLDGFETMRTTQSIVGNTSAMIGLGKPSSTAKPEAGPWDEFAQSIIGVMAAKNDVLVSVESGPFQADTSRSFVKKAIENLAR
jgi:hypothetical protein